MPKIEYTQNMGCSLVHTPTYMYKPSKAVHKKNVSVTIIIYFIEIFFFFFFGSSFFVVGLLFPKQFSFFNVYFYQIFFPKDRQNWFFVRVFFQFFFFTFFIRYLFFSKAIFFCSFFPVAHSSQWMMKKRVFFFQFRFEFFLFAFFLLRNFLVCRTVATWKRNVEGRYSLLRKILSFPLTRFISHFHFVFCLTCFVLSAYHFRIQFCVSFFFLFLSSIRSHRCVHVLKW